VEDLTAYYEETWGDYRWLWLTRANPAMHFGYWGTGVRRHAQSLVAMNRVMADAADVTPGDLVLDAGCGVGGSAIWLAKERQARVTGITPVVDQVEKARRFARHHRVESLVSFDAQDYCSPTLPTAHFDVVWAQESVCHAGDKEAFVATAHRVLKPGGRLVMTEYLRPRRPHASAGERTLHRWLSGWAIPDLATADEFEGWLLNAGFREVQLKDITANVRPSLRRLYVMTMLLYPGAASLRALRLRSSVQHGNLVAARTQWTALQRGLWLYGLVTATV
jgi:tocopherol O-methyltransferase